MTCGADEISRAVSEWHPVWAVFEAAWKTTMLGQAVGGRPSCSRNYFGPKAWDSGGLKVIYPLCRLASVERMHSSSRRCAGRVTSIDGFLGER